MSNWKNFNLVEDEQPRRELIPKGTLAKACVQIKPGGYDDPTNDWTGGYATHNVQTGSVYLQTIFTIVEGPYSKRKLWHCIGLYSPKGPAWGQQGQRFIKQLLNSAHGLRPDDQSPQACQARHINDFGDLDGLVCVIRIGVEENQQGEQKNGVQSIITPEHKDYAAVMGSTVTTVVQQRTTPHTMANTITNGPSRWVSWKGKS